MSEVVDIYDDATGTWSTATLSQPQFGLVATTVGTKAMFAGSAAFLSDVVEIYDDSTGIWSTTTLSQARRHLGAVTIGTKAMFVGGLDAMGNPTNVVDLYDDSTGTWATAILPVQPLPGGRYPAGVTVGNVALVAWDWSDFVRPNVIIFDDTAGLWSTAFTSRRHFFAATSVGSVALFGGGFGSPPNVPLSSIDICDLDFGERYCSPAVPNSTGLPGVTMVLGRTSVAANEFSLTADRIPPGLFGYFLTSRTQGFFMPPASQGFVCLGGDIGRYHQPQNIGQGPTFSIPVDLTSMPVNPTAAVQPGDTFNFQAWYRDVGGTNNFTDAVSVLFQ